ncbi:MAG: hypothetical protein WD533_06225 [Dehalococcoidia bacterium]
MKLGVSYFGNRIPEHFIRQDLPEIVNAGCTFALHTFSEDDLAHYHGSVRKMVQASKDAGLEVYIDPWGVAGAFGGETFSRFLLDHPEAWQRDASGTPVPLPCPNAPALYSFMDQWLDAAAGLGADVLFWDEPHFAKDAVGVACHCAVCQRTYEECYEAPLPAHATPQLARFQEDSLLRFVTHLCQQGASRGMRNALCLLPFDSPTHGLQHWERAAAIPHLDILGVTPFWHLRGFPVDTYLREWSAKVRDLAAANGLEAQVWLQAFLIDQGREPEVEAAARAACEAGIRNIAAWGFQGCGHMTALRPHQPEAVWNAVKRSFASLSDNSPRQP